MITGLSQDFRYAVRQLRKSPGFLAVVVLSLGLGIGANSTIFSVLNAVLYRPMPYDHPERLVSIWDTQVRKPEDGGQPPPIAEMNDWKSQSHVFEDIALTSWTERSTLSGLGEAEPIWVQNVTPNFFSLLGAKPVLGRISAADEMQDTTQTVVIGNSFWKRKFNGDPNALGKTFTVQGVVSTVVGVMPAGFDPFYGDRIDLWQPINPESSRYAERTDHWLMPVARLKPGVTLAQAQVEMDVIARRLEQAYPATNKDVGKKLVPLHQELFDRIGKSLYPLFGAVFFVLLIACVNVANLLQSRTEVRRKEYALAGSIRIGQAAADPAVARGEWAAGPARRRLWSSYLLRGDRAISQTRRRVSQFRGHPRRCSSAPIYARCFHAYRVPLRIGAGDSGLPSRSKPCFARRRGPDFDRLAQLGAPLAGRVGSGSCDAAAGGRRPHDQHHAASASNRSWIRSEKCHDHDHSASGRREVSGESARH